MADNIGEQPSCNYSCTCQDIREQVQWQLPLLKSSSQRQDCRQQVLSLQIGNGCKLIRSERLLSFHFYCCQEFTVYGSCPSVQSKRFGPACRFPLLLEPGGLLFSTSGPALSFLRPMELGKRISCVIKTVRHSGTKLPSLDYLTSKIYEGTEQFILVEESLFLFIQIVLPLWLIYLALMVVLNQLLMLKVIRRLHRMDYHCLHPVVVGNGMRCRLMPSWMVILCVSDDVAVGRSRILL
ncbi:uncharacterized protein LOC124682110 isoform X2 [Lolium rigidum]|uniref:uncharacterized protein LOC124682110 isoform X2 n=1 Tax=Lolium rigidum TaxID=89674 RepID=UPI001F5C0F5F|nr:uncharacterized protein LOC124682110 isoform X2 [Lolium rigidum]